MVKEASREERSCSSRSRVQLRLEEETSADHPQDPGSVQVHPGEGVIMWSSRNRMLNDTDGDDVAFLSGSGKKL